MSADPSNVVSVRPDLLHQLEDLVAYFRTDIHAVRFWDSQRERWGYKPVNTPVDLKHLAAHLPAGPHLGTYVIPAESDKVRVAVFDLDDHKGEVEWSVMVDAASRIIAACLAVNLYCWPIRPGGGRGIHLFIFWGEPVNAAAVRCTMEVLLESVGLEAGDDPVASLLGYLGYLPYCNSKKLEMRGAGNVLRVCATCSRYRNQRNRDKQPQASARKGISALLLPPGARCALC